MEGCCRISINRPVAVKYFETEDEAIQSTGNALGWCKTCLKKREQLLEEANLK